MELDFPLKSIPTVVAGLAKSYLPLHGPETLSWYQHHFPSCTLEFSQKTVACNHIHHDHLSIALACLYCSFENNPRMQWYIASTLEHHSLKHLKENLSIHPDDPNFLSILHVSLGMMLSPLCLNLNKTFLMRK